MPISSSFASVAMPRSVAAAWLLISTAEPLHHEIDERQHHRQRADDRRHIEVDLVEPQIADAERGQHMRQVGRPAAGQEIDAVEVAERPDRREQRAGQIERRASTAR